MRQYTVLILDPLPKQLGVAVRLKLNRSPHDFVLVDATDGESGLAAVENADFLLSYRADVNAKTVKAAKKLRLIVKYQSHDGALAVNAAKKRGISILEVPSLALVSVAEFTVMMMLALSKNLVKAYEDTKRKVWLPERQPSLTSQTHYAYNWVDLVNFHALYGKTAGLVGLGTIGTAVARLLRPFHMKILYTKRNRLSEADEHQLDVQYASLEDLLRRSDFVSLHVRLTEDSEKLLSRLEFAMMKPTAFLINTSRGRVVDEEALCEALSMDELAGAALDVFEQEPLPRESSLWNFENVIITPHVAGIPAAKAAKLEASMIVRSILECCD